MRLLKIYPDEKYTERKTDNKSFPPNIRISRQGWWIPQGGYHKQTAPWVHSQSGERITTNIGNNAGQRM